MPGRFRSPVSNLIFTALVVVQANAQGDAWHRIPAVENPVFPASMPIYQRHYASDTVGNVFMASPDRVLRYAGGVLEDISPSLPPGRVIHSLVADPAGIPWIAVGYEEYWKSAETKAGWSLHRRAGGAWTSVPHAGCGAGEALFPLGIDSAGRLILSSLELGGDLGIGTVQGLYRAGPAGCEEIPIPKRTDGTLLVEEYARGPDGAEYLNGTLASGDIILGGFLWEIPSGELHILRDSIHSIRSMIALDHGQVLALTNYGLATFLEGRARRIETIQGNPFRDATGLFRDSRGAIWVPYTYWNGTSRTARILRIHGGDTAFYETPPGIDGSLTEMVEDGDGNVWFQAQDGDLLIYSPGGKPRPLAIRSVRPSTRLRAGMRGDAAGSRDVLGRTALERPALRSFRPSR